mgnify:CR=1 FL=1
MKKASIYLIAFALLSVNLLTAANKTPAVLVKENTSKVIGELLEKPQFSIEKEIQAMVTFVVNSEKEIVVLTVDTESERIEGFVKSRLNYQAIECNLEEGVQYKVPIRIVEES